MKKKKEITVLYIKDNFANKKNEACCKNELTAKLNTEEKETLIF